MTLGRTRAVGLQGLVGFLVLQDKKQDFWAGASALLGTVPALVPR